MKNELRWVILGDSIGIQRFGQSTIGTIKVDLKKSPRQINIHLVEGPVPGERVYRGIYKREDARLTVCYAAAGEPRPTEFATKAGSSAMLAIFRWTEGRGHALGQGSRDVRHAPPLLVPKQTSQDVKHPLVAEPSLVVPPATVYNPYVHISPTIMPGGPVQLAPAYLKSLNEYKLTPSLFQQLQPLKLPPQINPYTVPPAQFKLQYLPPFELPKDVPPAKQRLDGSKDA